MACRILDTETFVHIESLKICEVRSRNMQRLYCGRKMQPRPATLIVRLRKANAHDLYSLFITFTFLHSLFSALGPPSLLPTMSTLRPSNVFTNPPNYSFPSHRLSPVLHNPQKHPIVLVACGSFSPVTYLHLRMFEMAKDYVRQNTDYEIVGGYLSPVSDKYKKPGLLSAHHR